MKITDIIVKTFSSELQAEKFWKENFGTQVNEWEIGNLDWIKVGKNMESQYLGMKYLGACLNYPCAANNYAPANVSVKVLV